MTANKQRNFKKERTGRRRGTCYFFIIDLVLNQISVALSADGVITLDIEAVVPRCLGASMPGHLKVSNAKPSRPSSRHPQL